MFERFTERARKVVVLAQEEARHFNHNYIGTEHLLLGLLREDGGVAARALSSLDVTLDEVREQVESIVGYGEEGTGGQAPFTPRSKKVLELSLRQALQLGHNYIGTEHILLGLVREFEGVAARVLSNLDVDPDKVRWEIVRILGGGRARRAEEKEAEGPTGPIRASTPGKAYRARVEGLVVQARCGVADEERAQPQPLSLVLDYSYGSSGEDRPSDIVDRGTLIEGVARLLEQEEFRFLETVVRRVGEHVLDSFPQVWDITVTVTGRRAPVPREVSSVSVEASFRR